VKSTSKKLAYILLLVYAVSFCLSIPQVKSETHGETGEIDDTPREYVARLLWANVTANVVNSSFPFTYKGSSTLQVYAKEELLSGAVMYMQTGNESYLEEAEKVCQWLDTHDEKKHLWYEYNTLTETWICPNQTTEVAWEVAKLASYVSLRSEWRPLLQEVVNEFIRIYIPQNTSRIYNRVDSSDNPTISWATSGGHSISIQALALAANVLDNYTIATVASNMVFNWTLGSTNLPYHALNQDGTVYSSYDYAKEDETFGNYLYAMEVLYYYYPKMVRTWVPLVTLKQHIYDVAFASQYMWNAAAKRWNYITNSTDGTPESTIAVHGFGMTDESLLAAYLIWGNSTWRDRALRDFDTMAITGVIINNGLIDHSTDLPDDSNEDWNRYARRFANIAYCFNGNSTFLNTANNLFINASQAHNRTYGWNQRIQCSTHVDYTQINWRVPMVMWLVYLNVTTASVEEFTDVFTYFGIPVLGNPYPNHYTFKGLIDEDTGLLTTGGVNVTAYFTVANTQPQTFFVNGSKVMPFYERPSYFVFDLVVDRRYTLNNESSQTIYIFNQTLTSYTIGFLDLANVLEDYPLVLAQRYVNGSLFTVEKRRVDVEAKIIMGLKQGETYTIKIQDGSTFTYGELLFGSDTTISLTLNGIAFSKETLMIYKYVRIYGYRIFGTPNGNITIWYQDLLEMTTSVTIYINYKNGTNAYNATETSNSFSHTWTSALNNTDYAVVCSIVHERYGSYDWKQYFPRGFSEAPFGLAWFGAFPFVSSVLIPSFLILFAGGCFSVINAYAGAFSMCVVAIILTYLGWIPIPAGALILAISLSLMLALVYAKARIET